MNRISVVVPIFNVEKYLRQCINSLLSQTVLPFEIILIDDGSEDSSGCICDEYLQKYPEIIKVVHKQNSGLGYARNTGIYKASGDYILFIDSDDFLCDVNAIKYLKSKMINQPDVIIYKECFFDDCQKKFYNNKRNVLGEISVENLIKNRYYRIAAWNKLIRKDFLIKNCLIFNKGISEDMLWCSNILQSNPKISYFLEKDILAYRINREYSGSVVKTKI